MLRAKTKKIEVVTRRGGALSDDELMRMMAVQPEQQVYRGVMEILDRLEDAQDHVYADPNVERDKRADAGLQKAAVREVRNQIAGWREQGEAFVKQNQS